MTRILLILIGLLSLITTSAFAVTIDFTDSTFSPGGASSITQTVGGITVKVEAIEPAGAALFWTGGLTTDFYGFKDGFGVNSTLSYEVDEVDGPDRLKVSFLSGSVILSSIGITNLFTEGNPSYQEQGFYSLDGGAPVSFLADLGQLPSPASNGVLTLTFPLTPVNYIIFSAPGLLNGQNHEFSVAGVEVTPVAEPGALLLVGTGLLAMSVWRRKGLVGRNRN